LCDVANNGYGNAARELTVHTLANKSCAYFKLVVKYDGENLALLSPRAEPKTAVENKPAMNESM